MYVLVTGGAGVIGSWVTRHLVELGITPVVYSSRADPALIRDVVDRVAVVRADILDLGALVRTIRRFGIRRVIHLSALMPPQCQENPWAAEQVNCGGTVNVLEAARSLELERVVYASAKGVYGVIPPPHGHPDYVPITEDYPRNPVSVYDATKLLGEHLGENYARNYGLQFVSLRYASTYGPGKLARHGPMSVHSRLVENALLGRPVVLPTGGDQGDDMIYMRDVAQATVKALLTDQLRHPVYNIGTGRAWTLRDFARAVQARIPGAILDIGPGLDYMGVGAYYSVFDCQRAKEDLGYEPMYDLEAGVADYIATMERLGLAPQPTP